MVSLALYWLTVRARGRALRVLAGSPTWRIQFDDLLRLLAALSVGAAVTGACAAGYVGVVHGWAFVAYYASALLAVDLAVLAATAGAAMIIAGFSWPTAQLIASRTPAAVGLRRTAALLQAGAFILVVAAVGPAVGAQRTAGELAGDQAQWRALSDQVALSFSSGSGDISFKSVAPRVGELVRDADAGGNVALSYTLTPESFGKGVEKYDLVSLVNPRWLDLFDRRGRAAPAPLQLNQMSPQLRDDLSANFALWARDASAPDATVARLEYFVMDNRSAVPLSDGGFGGLVTPDQALLVMVPDLHATFSDDYLAAVASSKNLVFTGLAPTEALVKQHALAKDVSVRYVAEEQILVAQFTEYFAHLLAASVVALFIALAIAAAVTASITAVVRARRDFPMRLAGYGWTSIIAGRVSREGVIAAVVAAAILILGGFDHAGAVLGVAALAVLISLLSHLAATRWMFIRIGSRKA